MYRVVLTQSHQPADHRNVPTVRPKFKVVRLIDLLPMGGGWWRGLDNLGVMLNIIW